jgi:hypothetical protein
MRGAGYVARIGEIIDSYKVLDGNSESKRTLDRRRHRWTGNIKINITEIGCNDVD